MPTLYWYRTCPSCDHQGRLFIYRRLDLDQLYLHCEECEQGYADPTDLRPETSFLPLLFDFRAALPSRTDITARGWDAYARHEVRAT
jgi:hypothetical protein